MDKAKSLTGVFAFITLFSFSTYTYAGDGTSFVFVNKTSHDYNIRYLGDIWFLEKEWPKNFKNNKVGILIRPGNTWNLYAEAACSTNTDAYASADWELYTNDPNKKPIVFKLQIPNIGGKCLARKFKVGEQYRKIELAPMPIVPVVSRPSTTPTPNFRFTIREQGNSVILDQEGPQAKSFN
jgi:hypothetical protein